MTIKMNKLYQVERERGREGERERGREGERERGRGGGRERGRGGEGVIRFDREKWSSRRRHEVLN